MPHLGQKKVRALSGARVLIFVVGRVEPSQFLPAPVREMLCGVLQRAAPTNSRSVSLTVILKQCLAVLAVIRFVVLARCLLSLPDLGVVGPHELPLLGVRIGQKAKDAP